MKKTKKVVAVIVEGPSDETALGGLLREYFSNEMVQFAIVHGDITVATGITTNNVVRMIKRKIDNDLCGLYGYKWSDFVQIIHIVDTDGAFIQNFIQEDSSAGSVKYYVDHIEAADVQTVKRRNARKAEVLQRLYLTGDIRKIRYQIYFNSCNLEHVLYNELHDFTDEDKKSMANDFADRFDGKLDEFKTFIASNELAVEGDYKQTWRYIKEERHSLERHSNMHLIFEDEEN